MNEALKADVNLHPLICKRMLGSIKDETASMFLSNKSYDSASCVVAFCHGHRWCCLLRQLDFKRFVNADVGSPIRKQYSHSIPVPEVLDIFCEELDTYRSRMMGDCFEFVLSIAHLALQVIDPNINPYGVEGRGKIRKVLIQLSIFYHLLY